MMEKIIRIAIAAGILLYNVTLIYFFADGVVRMAHVYSTLGQILLFIGVAALFIIIPFSSFFASLFVLYSLVEYKHWNLFISILFVFPGIAIAIASFFGIAISDAVQTLKTRLFHRNTNQNIVDVTPVEDRKGVLGWIDNYKRNLINFKDFSSKMSRKSFWKFISLHLIVNVLVGVVIAFCLETFYQYRYQDFREFLIILWWVISIILFVPQVAATIRRVNDTGYSPWIVWVALVLGAIQQFIVSNSLSAIAGMLQIIVFILSISIIIILCMRSK